MHSSIVKVSPSLAKEWLQTNTNNRKLSRPSVLRYAGDMLSGAWKLNHQGIAFDEEGVLVDGQHRLHAVIESNMTVPMLATWGADRIGIDELRVRSAAEVIKFGGMSNWIEQKEISTARQMIVLCSGAKIRRVYSTNDLLVFADKNRSAIEFSVGLFSTHTRGISSASCKAVIATASYYYDREDLTEFVRSLYSGVPTSADRQAVIKCRDMLLSGVLSRGGIAGRSAAFKMMRAVKAFCDRQTLKTLRERTEAVFLVPEDRL